MKTNLNEAIVQLKLQDSDLRPNLFEVMKELQTQQMGYYRAKIICMSEAVLESPENISVQAQLKSCLTQLNILQIA